MRFMTISISAYFLNQHLVTDVLCCFNVLVYTCTCKKMKWQMIKTFIKTALTELVKQSNPHLTAVVPNVDRTPDRGEQFENEFVTVVFS